MKTVVAGNWKMHHGPQRTRAFFLDFNPSLPPDGPEILFFPPAVSLVPALEATGRKAAYGIGVQNVYWEDEGAFTGEVSAAMAAQAGATHALVGHSERRHVFGETDREVTRKVDACGRHGLIPVVCVGETLEQRRAGRLEEVILEQLDAALDALPPASAELLVAYEPVWAIGTGETATPGDASSAHAVLRGRLGERLDPDEARTVPILYGGSVKPHNARELLAAEDVNGVLVGGASLDPESFARIAEAAVR